MEQTWHSELLVALNREANKIPLAFRRRAILMFEMAMFVVTGPTLLCAYVLVVWALTANVNLTTTFPWSKGPLSNWMIWLVLASTLRALTSKMRAHLNCSSRNYIDENMREEFTPARSRLAGGLTQKDDERFEPSWAADSVMRTGVRP